MSAGPGPALDDGSVRELREVRVHGALLPGLVNVHCHSPMTLFRGSGENLPLHRWLDEVLWPQEAHLTEEDVYWGMTLAAAELLCFGVTTTCEAYFFEDALADAVSTPARGPRSPRACSSCPGRSRPTSGG